MLEKFNESLNEVESLLKRVAKIFTGPLSFLVAILASILAIMLLMGMSESRQMFIVGGTVLVLYGFARPSGTRTAYHWIIIGIGVIAISFAFINQIKGVKADGVRSSSLTQTEHMQQIPIPLCPHNFDVSKEQGRCLVPRGSTIQMQMPYGDFKFDYEVETLYGVSSGSCILVRPEGGWPDLDDKGAFKEACVGNMPADITWDMIRSDGVPENDDGINYWQFRVPLDQVESGTILFYIIFR